MRKLTAIIGALALGIVGAALAQDKRPNLKIDPSLLTSVTPMERDTLKEVLRFLRGRGSPPPLAFKVPANTIPVTVCIFPPLSQINTELYCGWAAETFACPKEVIVRLPNGDTIVKEIECNGPPTDGPNGPECECDFKQ